MDSNVEIDNLTAEERLALLGELWDSLRPADVPVTEAQKAELDRRLDDLEGLASADLDHRNVGQFQVQTTTSKVSTARLPFATGDRIIQIVLGRVNSEKPVSGHQFTP